MKTDTIISIIIKITTKTIIKVILLVKKTKIAFGVVVGVGLIGFVKGVFVGYLIGHYKDKCSLHNIKCTDKTDDEQKR